MSQNVSSPQASTPTHSSSPDHVVPMPLVEAIGLSKSFSVHRGDRLGGKRETLRAVDGVDISVHPGQIVALVGESGCGKSTLGRLVLALMESDSGTVRFRGEPIGGKSRKELFRYRSRMQLVFQNPFSALNPRLRIRSALMEVLKVHGLHRGAELDRVLEVLGWVGLGQDVLDRFPREFSGGQLQRIGIARALLVSPEFIVADEPVSALDVSVQAQILNLIAELREKLSLSFLFIAHDLRVVEHIADRVEVMYLGRILESAPRDVLYDKPLHPYTQILFSAVPEVSRRDASRQTATPLPVQGELPSPIHLPPGCRFAPRCPHRVPRCDQELPALRPIDSNRSVACHLAELFL